MKRHCFTGFFLRYDIAIMVLHVGLNEYLVEQNLHA